MSELLGNDEGRLRGSSSTLLGAQRLPGGRVRLRGEQGYVLAMTALLMLPLMVFVSFAIDAGVWYAQASRMQRAADASALAAVVWLPRVDLANAARDRVAAQNGYTSGVSGSMTSSTTYQVTITENAPRFFSGTFTGADFNLGRSAKAEFNKPVPLGSPTGQVGNDVSTNCPQFQPSSTPPCGPQPMLWSAIQGPYQTFADGDPYTTKCGRNLTVSEAACSSGSYARGATNELYRTTGYQFAIDVSAADIGRPITLQVWDAGGYSRSVGSDSTTISPLTRNVDRVTTTSGSRNVTRTTGGTGFQAGDVGQRISGTGMPPGATVTGFTNVNAAQISANATSGGTNRTLTVGAGTVDRVTTTNNSANLTRSSGGAPFLASDVGRHVSGTGIRANTIITAVNPPNSATMSNTASSSGSGRTLTLSTASTVVTPFTGDCNQSQPPFTTAPYNGSVASANCQTGDSGSAPFELQVFDNDGQDLTVDFSTPLPACRLYVAKDTGAATYKNQWASVCTITPSQAGIFPIRVKSSAITGVTDTGNGWNAYAMRLQNATTTRLYALEDLSIWTNTQSSDARFYLADIGTEHAGKRLQLDLYDPGDGSGGAADYKMQVLAPPSGSPSIVPTTGTPIPAAGIVDSCRYNDTPQALKSDLNVTAPNGNVANNCTVTTRVGSTNKYNNNWLRIEIKISDSYTCSNDCWWSIKYDFGGASGIPTDRTVWSIKVVGDPVHLVE